MYFIDLFTDRELELRELRKVVLSSQEDNISLNKEMEELKVHLEFNHHRVWDTSRWTSLNGVVVKPSLSHQGSIVYTCTCDMLVKIQHLFANKVSAHQSTHLKRKKEKKRKGKNHLSMVCLLRLLPYLHVHAWRPHELRQKWSIFLYIIILIYSSYLPNSLLMPPSVIHDYLALCNWYINLLPFSVLQSLLQKVEDDLGAVKAYGASLTAQRNSLRMVPNLFGVINF